MTRMYLIRHAEAEGNIYRVFQGQRDTLLTETGNVQTRALAERFRDIHVDAVYSSDLYRAAATAAAICRVKGLPLERRTALREICVGTCEGRAVGDVHREQELERTRSGGRLPDSWNDYHGETAEQVRERMIGAILDIAKAHEGETVAVVSHGGAIRYVVEYLQGGKQATGQNTGISQLEVENGTLKVVSYNDASHLDTWMETLLGRPYHQRDSGLQPGLWYRTPTAEERKEWLAAAGAEIPEDADVLVGVRGEKDTGILALDPARDAEQGIGWIDLLWVKPELRQLSCGIQLLGQAVFRYRELGRQALRLQTGPDTDTEFLAHHGFYPVAEGVLEKSIAFPTLDV